MSLWAWLLLIVFIVIAEACTVILVSIWFACGSFVGLILAALHAPWWLQIIGALIVSGVLIYFTRPIAMKHFNRNRVKTNVSTLAGSQAIVTEEIDNLRATGQVIVNGQEWSARNMAEGEVIPEGAIVTIEKVKGVTLQVKFTAPAK
ncbi:MAG: NfeD family protein [Lachnospiraceae bacterium]|nr:NfeD family protein [Lachnospiraceae bacterium]